MTNTNRLQIATPLVTLVALASSAQGRQEAAALATTIDEVTLYADSALVRRASEPIEAGGRYLVESLPGSLDPEHVRVRCSGGHVVGVEVRERLRRDAPAARVEELRRRAGELEQAIETAGDEQQVSGELESFLRALGHASGPGEGPARDAPRVSRESWRASEELLAARLAETRRQQRELRWRIEELGTELADVQRELGAAESGGGVRLHEVEIEVEVPAGGARLALEYFVPDCGWSPDYDLRTRGDARQVELAYRAEVRQRSGEDWEDVGLLLSTAAPRRGARGPDPEPRWIDLVEPVPARGKFFEDSTVRAVPEERYADSGLLDFDANADGLPNLARPAPYASVQSEGLSLLFRIPRRETIESRDAPTTVLVGEARLEVEPEHYCAPALDETVWLRGRARNTSAWTLLPGPAAVFFGDDFLGRAGLGAVQVGEEFDLHLGAVPALSVERVDLKDELRGPGFLGSRKTKVRAWKVRVRNHGASVCEADGSVRVIVRDAVPRSTDDRVDVELEASSPKPSSDPRWAQDREELGVHTWVLAVPRSGVAELVYELHIKFPKNLVLGFW